MNTVTIGLEGKVYYLSTGTRVSWGAVTNGVATAAAPTGLIEATVVRDVNLNLTADEADVSSRASQWELMRKALKKADVELVLPWTPADAVFLKLLQTFLVDGASIALAILDGDKAISGSQGPWADFEVTEFAREEPLTGPMLAKVKLKPTSSAVPPQWVSVQ